VRLMGEGFPLGEDDLERIAWMHCMTPGQRRKITLCLVFVL